MDATPDSVTVNDVSLTVRRLDLCKPVHWRMLSQPIFGAL